ncbi:cytochrome-c peroxidase [Siphonobacter curvatus]|uniref:Methylamine utilization protein MauG n=1 Tax=Siphonobacter curvatus TaxID=2094562 RepID=A0A2S7IGQ6_9BACT|nr:cytochrome c peroxidase [Siphonobacter curvatus]PQA54950.1 cytochrome-c peroxidase [Siphonobacter curvatus]
MRFFFLLSVTIFIGLTAFQHEYSVDELRQLYSSGDVSRWPKPEIDSSVLGTFQEIGVLGKVNHPASNPYSEAKAKLGKLLFFDPRLSQSKQIACASCHDPELGWGDGRHLSFGHNRQNGKRNAMTILNTGHYQRLFWDGRAASLEEQVNFPVQDPLEMAQNLKTMQRNIRRVKGYRPHFAAAFGTEEVTVERIQQAIATFERTVVSPPSRFDRFVQGNARLLSDDEVLGLHLFRTKARCINCHNSPLFSDNQFHNDGQTLYGSSQQDFGKYLQTGDPKDVGKFRTPSLREVARTGPWMHHGNFPTLRDVIEYYNLGNPSPIQRRVVVDERLRPVTSPLLRKLHLTKTEQLQLEAFLKTISVPSQKINPFELPQ